MAMSPQTKDSLMRFTMAAKAVIYDADRMRQFLQMMNTKDGAITAVKSIMGVIEHRKPIPAEIAPLLGVNIYMLLVDAAQEITGGKPNPAILRAVIAKIIGSIQPTPQSAPQPMQQSPVSAQPAGMVNQPMGA